MLFDTVETVVRLMRKASTSTGLRNTVNVIRREYETGRKVADGFKANMTILFDTLIPSHYCRRLYFLNPTLSAFIEEQIFNWTYTDEQRAKEECAAKNPTKRNPYGALPQMRLLTYQMPDELLAIASAGEFDEFDLNAFFEASGIGSKAQFKHKSDVQKWLDVIRGGYMPKAVDYLKSGTRPPFPYSDVRLLPYLQHSFWFLPDVAACHAMANLLAEKHNTFWREYEVVVAAGASAGIGLEALPPVRKAVGSGFETKTITVSCEKLTTGGGEGIKRLARPRGRSGFDRRCPHSDSIDAVRIHMMEHLPQAVDLAHFDDLHRRHVFERLIAFFQPGGNRLPSGTGFRQRRTGRPSRAKSVRFEQSRRAQVGVRCAPRRVRENRTHIRP